MRSLNLPPTRANVAAQSGEWVALFDCLVCPNGVYIGAAPVCSCCGDPAPASIAKLMADTAARQAA